MMIVVSGSWREVRACTERVVARLEDAFLSASGGNLPSPRGHSTREQRSEIYPDKRERVFKYSATHSRQRGGLV